MNYFIEFFFLIRCLFDKFSKIQEHFSHKTAVKIVDIQVFRW